MCTVSLTFSTADQKLVLTSNRDEAPGRSTLSPAVYVEDGFKMLYPKDVRAGGTWLGVGENKRVICLLNGGFERHQRKEKYRLSRGIVLKDILKASDFSEAISEYDLHDVEPFTMIIADWKQDIIAAEMVWNGTKKHLKYLPEKPLLWSSSPLYSKQIKKKRENWFRNFFQQRSLDPENLLEFHFSAGKGDPENGVVMNRGFVKTKSISQIVVSEEKISFHYFDVEAKNEERKLYDHSLKELI